jgi:hypothetical protein
MPQRFGENRNWLHGSSIVWRENRGEREDMNLTPFQLAEVRAVSVGGRVFSNEHHGA